MRSNAVIIDLEPTRPVILAFNGNTATNDMETSLSLNLHLNYEPEPAAPVISAFCRNTAPNDSETYQTLNLHLNTEPAGLVNPAFHGHAALNDSETD